MTDWWFLIQVYNSLAMGNTESGYDDDSHEHFRHQRPSYGGSSMDHNYQPWSYTESSMDHSHQPTSYAGSSAHHSHQPMSYAGSSAHHNYQRPQQATRFADNYNTLDEVFLSTTFTPFWRHNRYLISIWLLIICGSLRCHFWRAEISPSYTF